MDRGAAALRELAPLAHHENKSEIVKKFCAVLSASLTSEQLCRHFVIQFNHGSAD
jgi:hypothetical protein